MMEKIAIIGLSCLLPDAETPAQFWQNLLDEKSSISEASIAQMGADPAVFYQPGKGHTAGVGKHYCNQGGFIQNFQFDPTGYAIAPELLQSLDVSHQWSLYVAREALRDSGYWGKPVLEKCGVILGSLALSTRSSQRLVAPIYQQVLSAGVEDLLNQPFQLPSLPSSEDLSLLNVLTTGYPSAVVAQALALAGVNFSFDGACSSPLYAVRMACQYLQTGKADLMLAGSVSAADPLLIHTLFSLFQAHSEDGHALPLDEASSGLLTGEGAGMLALKRYSDAVRDGDRIYATILGVGLSNDGRGRHILSPNPKGQITAYERAYVEANIDPKQVAYVECHGTGTPLGDRTEMDTLEAFFGKHGGQPKVGSVKSNVGHLLTAAGMPSLLKVILSLKEGVIPPTLHVKNPISSENGVIGADQIVRSRTPFPEGARHAAVSAFGFGGTNAHMVLESAAEAAQPVAVPPVPLAKMAIVGMDAFFGQCPDLDAFERCIYNGSQQFIALPEDRWQGIDRQSEILKAADLPNHEAPLGAYIAEFEFDHLQFKIPPNADDPLIPQQLLLMNVAEKAIRDANLTEGWAPTWGFTNCGRRAICYGRWKPD
jgi:acyl transferase domain-containing protein